MIIKWTHSEGHNTLESGKLSDSRAMLFDVGGNLKSKMVDHKPGVNLRLYKIESKFK